MKRLSALLLAAALLAALCACGEETAAGFRTLEVIGERSYHVICRKDDALGGDIDEAMKALAYQGVLSSLSSRWLGRDAITLRGEAAATPDPAEETEPSAEEAEAAAEPVEAPGYVPPGLVLPGAGSEAQVRRIIFGVEQGFRPMAYADGDTLRGMNIDIGNALGEYLGCEVTYQTISPSEVDTQLASGNIDCALGFDPVTVNPEKFAVGVSWLRSDVVLAVRSGSSVKRLRDLEGQRIGTVDDTSVTAAVQNHEKLTRYAAGATVYLTPARCVTALDNGWCAAIAMDSIMLAHIDYTY